MLRTQCSRPSCSSLMAKFCKIGSYLQFWLLTTGWRWQRGTATLACSTKILIFYWILFAFKTGYEVMMLRYISSQSRARVPVTENVELYFQSRPDVLVAGPREVLPLMCRHQSCSLGVIIYLQLNIYRYLGPDWITCRWRNKQLSRNWKWGAEARVYSVYCF